MIAKVLLVIAFVAVAVAVGIYCRRHTGTVDGFILGGRNVGPWMSAFAYGTSYFSAVVFVGYAGQFGFKYGISATWAGIGNAIIGSLLAWWVLGPRTREMTHRLQASTMPEFFGKRYDSRALRIAAAAIIFVFLIPYTASVYNGLSRLFGMAFALPYDVCVIGMAVVTCVYVVLGGYMATVMNDFIQGIVMLLGILTAWTVAFGTKESTSALRAKAQKNGNPLEAFKALFQNDQLLWVALSYLLYAIANVATTGVLLFLFKFVLDNPAAYSATGVIALVAGLIMAPLYPILNKRIPRRYLYISGMISMIVAYVLLGLFSTNIVVVFIALVLFYVPGTLIQMTAILSLTDSIEYGQLKNGKRNEAVTLSVRPMLDKIGGALSNGITGFIAVAAGMTGSATAADMTPANIHTFEVCAFYVPLVLIVLSLLVFTFKVKISEKMHAEIVEQLEAKLTAGEVSDEEAKTVGRLKPSTKRLRL